MKILGLIGGVGPESTVDYYKQIIALYRQRRPDGSYPPLLLTSLNLQHVVDLVTAGKLDDLSAFLANETRRLAGAGADFAALAANTPHIVFDDVRKASPIPLISIVEATRDDAARRGLRRVALFGTRFTMRGGFYPAVFEPAGIALVTPTPDDVDYIHEKYMGELVLGRFLPETRARLEAIARGLVERERVEGVILGGTELPLILKDSGPIGVPLLDTTAIHVARIVDEMLSQH